MEIKELGEFGLINRLTKDLQPKNASTLKGVGDDCTVLDYPDKQVLITTDMLMRISYALNYDFCSALSAHFKRIKNV